MSALRDTGTLRHYVHIVARRKWTILLPTLLVPAALVYLSLRSQSIYESTAQVAVNQQNVAGQLLTGVAESAGDPQRTLQTQAQIARAPAIAKRALDRAKITSRTPRQLLGESSVGVASGADILVFSVRDADPSLVARLTTAYASGYSDYRKRAETDAVDQARRELLARLKQFTTPEDRRSAAYAELLNREQQLRVVGSLQASSAYVLQPAHGCGIL